MRAQFARLINAASPDEIGLLFSTGEGENVVAAGLELKAGRQRRDRRAALRPPSSCCIARSRNTRDRAPRREASQRRRDASDFEPLVDRRTRLVSVAWVSHLNGFRHDMRPIADIAHANGALFYADAIQACRACSRSTSAARRRRPLRGLVQVAARRLGVAPLYIRTTCGSCSPGPLRRVERRPTSSGRQLRDSDEREALRLLQPRVRRRLRAERGAGVSREGRRRADRSAHGQRPGPAS